METLNGWHSAAEIKKWKMPLVRSVGVVIEVTDEMVVLAGDYSAPGDELNRLTRIPASMVRAVRVLEKKPYMST